MKRLFAFVLIMCLSVCCAEGLYESLEMDAKYETVISAWGEAAQSGEYLLIDDALISFYVSGRLQAKCLAFEDVSDVAALTESGFDKVLKFRQGTKLEALTDLLGEGREIMRINIADEENPGLRVVFAWKNTAGDVIEALFEQDAGVWVLFAIAEVEHL